MLELIDSHCHLDLPQFINDRPEVLARAKAAGVIVQIIPGICSGNWNYQREICESDASLYPAYGLHPCFTQWHHLEDISRLENWLIYEKPCALGECGLDFFIEKADRKAQYFYFQAQLELAASFNLPLIIHARGKGALEAVIYHLQQFKNLRGVIHSFSGSLIQAKKLWDRGFLIGLGGPLTWPRARKLRALVASMPLEYLVLETDAPDQPDSEYAELRKPNEPARLAFIAKTVAQLRQQPLAEIAAQTTANARRLFNLTV